MGTRVIVTARQARLGAELRRLREAAGLTVRQAARELGGDESKISHVEAGRMGAGEERVRRMAALYDCLDEAFIDALVAMTGDRPKQWWGAYRGKIGQNALDLAELEHHAHALHTLQVAYVPGLLQTEEYMRAVLSYSVPEPSSQDLEIATAFRTQRRSILDREPDLAFHAVIHEAALRTRVADGKVARAQLRFILEQSDRANVTAQVIPFDADNFGGAGHSILHARASVPQLDTVVVDAMPGAVWLDAEAQLGKYRALLDKVHKSALSQKQSQDLIQRLTREL
jgi:transcriptional regulator with XRE-family HTH domain